MSTVRVGYEQLDDSWVATSPDLPGYRAVADGLADLRSLVFEGVPFFVEDDEVDIREEITLPGASSAPVAVAEVSNVSEWATVSGVHSWGRRSAEATFYRGSFLRPVPTQGEPSMDEGVPA